MKKTVAVDLDGVLAQYDGWQGVEYFGDPIPGSVEFTQQLAENYDIIIHTCRCYEKISHESIHLLRNRVRDWLDQHGYVYHYIHIEEGKPIASAYIDDNAIRCEPEINPSAYNDVMTMLNDQI